MAKSNPISVTEVKGPRRSNFLINHVGGLFAVYETLVFNLMGKHTSGKYNGGNWKFMEGANGAFYMSLDSTETFDATNPDNWFEGEMSAEALSLGVNILVQNRLIWELHAKGRNVDALIEKYDALREIAYQNAECSKILSFID